MRPDPTPATGFYFETGFNDTTICPVSLPLRDYDENAKVDFYAIDCTGRHPSIS